MSSIAISLCTFGFGVGSLVGSLIVKVVKDGSKRGGQPSWLASNINRGHYDYYYAFLLLLNLVNFKAYGSTQDIKNWDEEVDAKFTSGKK
ncbi:Protein NRT1/ PTR FAMILY 1.2, partial [Mucuna pruriens]